MEIYTNGAYNLRWWNQDSEYGEMYNTDLFFTYNEFFN